jgi:4'-phosphopantetheinyl transferase EntD
VRRSEAIETLHGRCVIVDLDDGDESDLFPDEQALADKLGPIRRREMIAGRSAIRHALGMHVAVLPDDRGAPQLPEGWVGSISHKGARAAALVAPAGTGFVGIDIEVAQPSRQSIESRILTPHEQSRLRDRREVTLYFAIKEAVYKAIDPIVRRYVGFTEVEIDLAADGSCEIRVLDVERLPVSVEAAWQERDGFWLATARGRSR